MNIKEYILNNIIKLPNIVNVILMKFNSFPEVIYGKACVEYKEKIISDKISTDNIGEKVLEIVRSSIENVPYYNKKYNAKEIKNLDDFLKIFEFIDKEIIMNDYASFVDNHINQSQFSKGATGGTSGKPLQLLMPNSRHIVELGTIHALWGRFGYNYSKRAVLRNHKLSGGFIINPITKEFIFDGFDLTDKNFSLLYSVMRKNNVEFFQCYPSSGYEFATYLKNNELDVSFIKGFLVSSENVLEHQREIVKSLGINYFSLYGHSEKLVMAANCPHSDYYHIIYSYGYLELISEDGKVISEEGVIGEIVGTTINNFGFPLLRYKTGDFAEYINIDCKCGYKGKALKSIYGRWSGNKIYNKDGTFITTTALNLHNDLYSVIDGLQYIQKNKGELIVNIIPGKKYNNSHELRLYEHFITKLNDDAVVRVCEVESLIRQSNGKFLLLLSNLN